MFPPLTDSDRLHYPDLEAEILEFWKRERVFEKSI